MENNQFSSSWFNFRHLKWFSSILLDLKHSSAFDNKQNDQVIIEKKLKMKKIDWEDLKLRKIAVFTIFFEKHSFASDGCIFFDAIRPNEQVPTDDISSPMNAANEGRGRPLNSPPPAGPFQTPNENVSFEFLDSKIILKIYRNRWIRWWMM